MHEPAAPPADSLRAFVRAYPVFALYFALCSFAVLVPIVAVRFLPLLDWPQHLSTVAALAHMHDPAWGFDRFLRYDPQFTYLGFYALAAALAKVLSVEVASRVALAVPLVATPAAVAFLLRARGRSPWPALFAFCVGFSWPFYAGFAPYLFAVPWVFTSLGLLERLSRAHSRKTLVAFALSTSVLFASHVLAFALFVPMAAVAVALAPQRRALARRVTVASLPVLALFVVYVARIALAPTQHLGRSQYVAAESFSLFQQLGPEVVRTRLERAQLWFNEGFVGNADFFLAQAWALCAIALFAASVYARRAERRAWMLPEARRAWLVPLLQCAVPYLGFLLVPEIVAKVWAVGTRMLVVAGCAMPLLLPEFRSSDERRSSLRFAPVLLVIVAAGSLNLRNFKLFQYEIAGLDRVLEALPRGQRVAALLYGPPSEVMSNTPFVHVGAYAPARRGGVVTFDFAHVPTHPVRFAHLAPTPFPGRHFEWNPATWRYDLLSPFTDYVLLRGRETLPDEQGVLPDALVRVAREGEWTLLRNTHAAPGVALYSARENLGRAEVLSYRPARCRVAAALREHQIDCGSLGAIYFEERESPRGKLPCVSIPVPQTVWIGLRFRDVPAEGAVVRGLLEASDEFGSAANNTPLALVAATLEAPDRGLPATALLRTDRAAAVVDALRPRRPDEVHTLTLWVSSPDPGRHRVCAHLSVFDQ